MNTVQPASQVYILPASPRLPPGGLERGAAAAQQALRGGLPGQPQIPVGSPGAVSEPGLAIAVAS